MDNFRDLQCFVSQLGAAITIICLVRYNLVWFLNVDLGAASGVFYDTKCLLASDFVLWPCE